MSLEDIVSKVRENLRGVKDYFSVPQTVDNMQKYALSHYLSDDEKKRLFEGKSPDEKQKLYENLSEKLNNSISKYQDNLNNLGVKLGKTTGAGSVLYDAYNLWNGIPGEIYAPLKYGLVTGKTLVEAPSMLKYFSKSKDLKGVAEYAGSKALHTMVPLFGSLFDRNVAQRVIKKGAIREAVNDFLKENEIYRKPLYKKLYDRVKDVAGPIKPKKSAYSPAYI
ncbi:MAG: hypothetical protein ACOCQX_01745 [Candidatus Nanoarchaeia archaeon]